MDGGAEGLTLTNTLLGLALDIETGRPVLGAGGGGLSGAVLHPVAVRAVWECRASFPDAAIIGAGGVASGRDAVEFLRAGADAVQVGTAIFRDPGAPWKVLRQLTRWCAARGTSVGALRASARTQRTGRPDDVKCVANPGASTTAMKGDPVPAMSSGTTSGTVRASFGARVSEAVGRLGPLCAGIDPSAALLGAWGLPDDAGGLRSFCGICVEAFGGAVAVIKPQVAFFERHGSAGLAELERLLVEARAAELLVLADAKRGDIDTTAAAYADAWLGEGSTLAADAVTVHPYLGLAALAPLITLAGRTGRGVIVVTRSSNPEGRLIQEAVTKSGDSVEESLLAEIAAWNESPDIPSGTVGAVVGATLPRSVFPLSQLGGVILLPAWGRRGPSSTKSPNVSAGAPPERSLQAPPERCSRAGPKPAELRRAAADLSSELAAVLG